MAINDLAAQLIHDLRFDAHTRKHFSISSFSGRGTCGSVGCIAGTAIYRALPDARKDGLQIFIPDETRRRVDPDGKLATTVEIGAIVLGIPSAPLAKQLFLPWQYWQQPLLDDAFTAELSHNERPDLSTVEKMVSFARDLPRDAYHPTHCANTLENLLKHERAYVDWAEGWEDA